MPQIPFTKAHGARNDFLLTWSDAVPEGDQRDMARAICDRHSGVGADGWLILTKPIGVEDAAHIAIRLYNADGSDSEISGNGTRCAAALAVEAGLARGEVRVRTGAGLKTLWHKGLRGQEHTFEMNMGAARVDHKHYSLPLSTGPLDVTILNVGNPQCVTFVPDFTLAWRALGEEIESHRQFPDRTNVSFVRVVSDNKIEVRIWERGVGATESSGTGATGAGAAAHARGLVRSPVTVQTPSGALHLRWDAGEMYLTGPAEIAAQGAFYYGPPKIQAPET